MLSFLAFKSRNYTNVHLLWQFPCERERRLHLALSAVPREMANVFVSVMQLLLSDLSIFKLRNKIGESVLDIDPAFSDNLENIASDHFALRQYKAWLQQHSNLNIVRFGAY